MFRLTRSIYEWVHDFTASELDQAATQAPDGWSLDRAACRCASPDEQGWVATIAFVRRDGRAIRVASPPQADPALARRDALESVPDARRMIEAIDRGYAGFAPPRRAKLTAFDPPAQPTLRPSVMVSLRSGEDRLRR